MTTNNFLVSTDSPMDEIIYLNSVSFSAPTPASDPNYVYTIAHGLPFIPLVGGGWSDVSDFNTSYDYYTGTKGTSALAQAGYLFTIELRIYADATNIYIVPINQSGSATTLYARVFAFEPSDSQATLTGTSASADNFVLNLEQNYPKLFKQNLISSVVASSTYTISHDIGVVPQVMVWVSDPSTYRGIPTCYPNAFLVDQYGDPYQVAASVDTTNVTFTTGFSSIANRIDYRIYYDRSGM